MCVCVQLGDAESYEERSLIRQALRQKKKERGELVKRPRGKGSVYNRFASSARSTAPSPKNYVASAQSVVSCQYPNLVFTCSGMQTNVFTVSGMQGPHMQYKPLYNHYTFIRNPRLRHPHVVLLL